jgi:heparan-alpha-glucosaminide N-acetyltransferase
MTTPAPTPARVGSIDAYRGLVMLLMMAEVLHFASVAENIPGSPVWRFLARCQTHVEWTGCTLHDLIQPSFSFLVGAALPFSLASRTARGQSLLRQALHALWRSIVLIALGIFLRSVGKPQTNFTFEDTLTQIGLGFFALFWLGRAQPITRWFALASILIGYWAIFAVWTLPGAHPDLCAPGVPPNWPYDFNGFAAHWNKNANFGWAFDTWFLNLFPRAEPFTHNGGGYATLSFIPTLGTMILGLIAGDWLWKPMSNGDKVGRLVAAGAVSFALGWAADSSGVCPSVKRIWTPSWVLVSGGYCFVILAAFYAVIDWAGFRWWAMPLRVIGVNSIAAYCMDHLMEGFLLSTLQTHLGARVFARVGPYEPLAIGTSVLLIYWLILFWMDRRRIYLRI